VNKHTYIHIIQPFPVLARSPLEDSLGRSGIKICIGAAAVQYLRSNQGIGGAPQGDSRPTDMQGKITNSPTYQTHIIYSFKDYCTYTAGAVLEF
jgi:hypothetical protein